MGPGLEVWDLGKCRSVGFRVPLQGPIRVPSGIYRGSGVLGFTILVSRNPKPLIEPF